MFSLYPLILRPEFQDRVWGARDLSPIYSQPVTGGPVGEAWLTGERCKIANGPLAGRSLGELSLAFGLQLFGKLSVHSRFPLLLKFLFPQDKLSVQVHPDDETAVRLGHLCGKTECWYVVKAAPGSRIGLGLKPGAGKAEVRQAIKETRLEELLNWIDLREGDMIYVEAGTVHTIGPGAVLAEIQQNSDITYRLYDYGRPRDLHIEHGLAAARESTRSGRVERGESQTIDGKTQVNLITAPYFVVDKFTLTTPLEFRRPAYARTSVWCLVVLRGSGAILADGAQPALINAGESAVIPAALDKFTFKPQWEVEFLCSSLPTGKVDPPRTIMPPAL